MNIKYLMLTVVVILSSCTVDVTDTSKTLEKNKITFIGNQEDPDITFVIKRMIRNSILEEEYILLNQQDTIEYNSSGKAFFKIGQMTKILDSLIVDAGDTIKVDIKNDTLRLRVSHSDVSENLRWLRSFYNKVEEAYERVLEPIKDNDLDINILRKPLSRFNNYESEELTISHPYFIDRADYNKNKEAVDQQIKETYLKFDSLITTSTVDIGSKRIMSATLFNSTVEKFRRMGSTVQDWLYDLISDQNRDDCTFQYTTDLTEFYLEHQTAKHFQKITHLDLFQAYSKIDSTMCLEFRKELQRLCLYKLYAKGNRPKKTNRVLESYMNEHNDSSFYKLITSIYPININSNTFSSSKNELIDINNQRHEFDQILQDNKGKVVLIDFWASWCVPCRKGMPDVKRLEEKFGDENFKVIYVSIDRHINQWERASKDEEIWGNNNYWATNWSDSEISDRYTITHIPRYIIYDQMGELAYLNAPKPDALDDVILDLID